MKIKLLPDFVLFSRYMDLADNKLDRKRFTSLLKERDAQISCSTCKCLKYNCGVMLAYMAYKGLSAVHEIAPSNWGCTEWYGNYYDEKTQSE